jgi:hypothetical protein
VLVPGTRWLLASGRAPGAGLTLVGTQAKAVRKLHAPGIRHPRSASPRGASASARCGHS